ncbi:MAG: hypothetical protein AVDCRST_MAG37-2398, partial [uncultured Rubrobacteraceae bacterium]
GDRKRKRGHPLRGAGRQARGDSRAPKTSLLRRARDRD